MSTPIFDFGRSFTWPTEARTSKPRPRYFLMVLAFAGDSTMTRLGPPSTPLRARFVAAGAFSTAAGFAARAAFGFAAALTSPFAVSVVALAIRLL